MKAQAVTSAAHPRWQRELAAAVRDPAALLARLGLAAADVPGLAGAAADFPLLVPEPYLARIRPGDPRDPLLLQVLPQGRELEPAPGFGPDPLGERAAMTVPGVLHKYRGRVLLVAGGACAVHCRYCFRRHFPYGEAHPAPDAWGAALDYLAARPEVSEVILSGGDPLLLPDRALARLAGRLAALPHLRRLRVHTRLPVVLPSRVQPSLLDWLAGGRLQPVVVIHANHPRELDGAVAHALADLAGAGVRLLNQSVLLRGVNDDAAVLAALSEALCEAGVLPYYLHLLDPVQGAAHFQVPQPEARALHAALRARLPGYLVPRLVREEPGAPAKVPL
jgi:EF-P beta-lysylation protein EpmB